MTDITPQSDPIEQGERPTFRFSLYDTNDAQLALDKSYCTLTLLRPGEETKEDVTTSLQQSGDDLLLPLEMDESGVWFLRLLYDDTNYSIRRVETYRVRVVASVVPV